MNNIPEKCIGCPELKKHAETEESASKTLDQMAEMLGISKEDLATTILNEGLDATEALTGIPNRMIKETKALILEAYTNRSWAQQMTFGEYLLSAYGTQEPTQFKTLIEVSPWKSGYNIPFDIAIGMFDAGNEAMQKEIEAQGSDDMQNRISGVTTQTYDMVATLTSQIDSANAARVTLIESCDHGLNTSRKFLKTKSACGSTALKNSTIS